jgi:hypothetical protein
MGRASRRKRERLNARPASDATGDDLGTRELTGAEPDLLGANDGLRHRWGGRRVGAGRPRLYATSAERQAVYRARRRQSADADAKPDGKPPKGGAPERESPLVRDPCA